MKIITSLNTNIIKRLNYQQVLTYLISTSERNKTDRTELWWRSTSAVTNSHQRSLVRECIRNTRIRARCG